MLCPYVNQYPAGEGLLQAYLRESVARELSWVCLVLGAAGVLLYALLTRAGLWLEGGLCLGLGLLALAAAVSARLLSRLRAGRGGTGQETVGIVEFGPRIRVTEGAETFWADYGQIVRVKRLSTLSVLQLDSGEAIVLANAGFTRGEPEHFWPFLEKMMTRRRTDSDKMTPKRGGREQI